MELIQKQLKNPLALGIAGFLAGVFFGLVILGWWLTPVRWENAGPSDLTEGLQVEWLRMTLESFERTGNVVTAKQRWDALHESGPAILEALKANPGNINNRIFENFEKAIEFNSTASATALPGEPTESAAPPEEEKKGLSTGTYVLLCVIGLVVVGGGAVAWYLFRDRSGGVVSAAQEAMQMTRDAQPTDYSATGEDPPVAQFMTTYLLGDDLFDDSFSIDSPAGEFLGECGVGIADNIGVGDPKRVSAYEVWLFDKNDIQTVTKVVMSSHGFNDDATRTRLTAKGEPVMAGPGEQVVLETQTLQLVARIVDMTYGEGALPAESFFERMTLELAIWSNTNV